MKKTISATLIILIGFMVISLSANAAKKGANMTIRHGTVEKVEDVQFQSSAGGGALVGGIIGYNMRSDRSKSKRMRNAIIGAGVGASARSAAEGDLQGKQYTVKATDGTQIKIVTDQTEIRKGDCVAVEQSANTANIRRVDKTLCEKDSKEVAEAVAEESQEEAQECLDAKQEMLAADTEEKINLAMKKIKVLCNN
jgi:outer membrane lipoprotein SlyB